MTIFNRRLFAALFALLAALTPSVALASFSDRVETGRRQTAELSQQQLDSLNSKVFTDAFIDAKIVGFDSARFAQLEADVRSLKQDNARLSALLESQPAAVGGTSNSLEARVAKLEFMFAGLQDSLVLLLNMISEVLNLLR